MNPIKQAIFDQEEHDWSEVIHDSIIKNIKSGKDLLKANEHPYLKLLEEVNPRMFKGVTASTKKSSHPYTPQTATVQESRIFLENGTLQLRFLDIRRCLEFKGKIPAGIPVEVVITATTNNPLHIYFWDEIDGMTYHEYNGTVSWGFRIKGSIYGGSVYISKHEALMLYALGQPVNDISDSSKINKRYEDEIAKYK